MGAKPRVSVCGSARRSLTKEQRRTARPQVHVGRLDVEVQQVVVVQFAQAVE
jgi:hypothetical protein